MKPYILLLVIAFVLPYGATGQNYTFKVLVNKGSNEVKMGGAWAPVKVGANLNTSDEVKLGPNSYIGLVHATGRPLELKKEGVHKVSDLAGQIKSGSGVLNKYTDFILSENTKPANSLTATGAVHRGVNQIELYFPVQNAVVLGPEVTLHWDTEKVAGPYVVAFKTLFEDELKVVKTSDSVLTVNLYEKPFHNEDNILVFITSESGDVVKTDPHPLKKISKADRERLKSEYEEVSKNAGDSAMGQYMLAGFFVNQKLYLDAMHAYNQAIKMAPDVESFQTEYMEFLLRHDLKRAKKSGE